MWLSWRFIFGTIIGNPVLKLPSIRLTIAALLMSVIHTHQRQRSDWLLFFGGCQNFLHPKWQRSQFFSWHFGWISIFPIQQKGAFFVVSKNHPNPFGQISKLQSFGLLSCQNSTNESTGSGREETRPAIGWIWRKKHWWLEVYLGDYTTLGVLKTLVV